MQKFPSGFLSSRNPREEFIAFFKKHCIDNPNVVMIGFRGDIRPLLRNQAHELASEGEMRSMSAAVPTERVRRP